MKKGESFRSHDQFHHPARRALFPYAVVLQVTPIVAIAPLIIIWVKDATVALFICAWLVAFFPVVANTVTGLKQH